MANGPPNVRTTTAGRQPVQREVHPQAALIEAQNAARLSRRREAAIMAEQFAATEAQDLSRFGDPRKVGGRFERFQKVPKGKKIKPAGLSQKDIEQFLKQFSFQPFRQELDKTSGFGLFTGDVPETTYQIISPF